MNLWPHGWIMRLWIHGTQGIGPGTQGIGHGALLHMIGSCEAMAQLPPSAEQYCTVLDHGSRIKDQGSWTLDLVLA